jgi:tetratricopeptide (TPR) repeat protein
LLVIGAWLVAYKKLGSRPPPPAAVETLMSAQADASKDTLASIASAEAKAKDAVAVAGPNARFPASIALLARIEIQWADALNDQAAQLADEGKASKLQAEAKSKLKSAFDLLSPALKANKESADLQLAFADYYRAQRLPSSTSRYLAKVTNDPRAAVIQALAASQEEDGAEKAIPMLKAALAADPASARLRYRLALAHLAAKDEASARAELKEVLRLSPQHERARALAEQLGPASTAGQK